MFFPVLGRIHFLIFSVGCIGTLMANTGLSDMFKAAFRAVDKMLQGKKFPQNTCALRICAEEVLR